MLFNIILVVVSGSHFSLSSTEFIGCWELLRTSQPHQHIIGH